MVVEGRRSKNPTNGPGITDVLVAPISRIIPGDRVKKIVLDIVRKTAHNVVGMVNDIYVGAPALVASNPEGAGTEGWEGGSKARTSIRIVNVFRMFFIVVRIEVPASISIL